MENSKAGTHSKPVITQTTNNTTLWIGHLQNDPQDHFAGQTFTCPADGQLDNIQVYTEAVQQPGELQLTLHEFDEASHSWGPSIGVSKLKLDTQDDGKWVRFSLPSILLRRNATYGFRLQTSNAMIGIGEAAAGNREPFAGQEWSGDSFNFNGQFFHYFSLAFKVEMRA